MKAENIQWEKKSDLTNPWALSMKNKMLTKSNLDNLYGDCGNSLIST